MTISQRPEPLLPLGLRLRDRRVLVVGGGPVALRRVGALLAARAGVVLVSPIAVAALDDLAERNRIEWHQRPYEFGDLRDAWLAMACTADAEVNSQVLESRGRSPHLLPAGRRRLQRLGLDAGHRPSRTGHGQCPRRPRPADRGCLA